MADIQDTLVLFPDLAADLVRLEASLPLHKQQYICTHLPTMREDGANGLWEWCQVDVTCMWEAVRDLWGAGLSGQSSDARRTASTQAFLSQYPLPWLAQPLGNRLLGLD